MKRTFLLLSLTLVAAGLYAQDTTRLCLGYDSYTTKDQVTAAVDGVARADFERSSRSQILNALYGLIPGLQLFQSGSGALPENIYPGISVRGRGSYFGNHVLVLVDGVPRDASYIDTQEVESVTVLKDAASLALYGIRGADGAVLITTRRGGKAPFQIKAGYRFGLQSPLRVPEMATPVQYAEALNEARANDGLAPYFSASDVASLKAGTNTVIPVVDWQKQILRKFGFDNDVFLAMDGSSRHTDFFVYADYRGNRGFMKNTDLLEGLDCQNSYDGLKIRSNLDIAITPTTKVVFNLSGRIQQHSLPFTEMALDAMYAAPAIGFPVMFDNVWARSVKFENPVESILGTGTNVFFSRMLSADFSLRQDLVSLLKGLAAEVRLSYDNSADILDRKSFGSPYYIFTPSYDASGNVQEYSHARYGNATEMSFSSFLSRQFLHLSLWGKVGWERRFSGHHVDASLLFNRDKRTNIGANASFIHHDYIFTARYDYAGKYLASVTANYSGSSLMPRGDKFRLYPAASLGWVISREGFLQDVDAIEYLKIRGSYGQVGMDGNLSYDMDVQFNGGGNSYMFVSPTILGGGREGTLPSVGIEPELDTKADIGLEFRIFHGLSGEVDLFTSNRRNLRTTADHTVSEVLGIGISDAFNGRTTLRGADVALAWNGKIGNLGCYLKGTAAFTKTKITAYDEPYRPGDYLYLQGNPIGRFFGLRSDGYYQESDFDASGNLLPGVVSSTFARVRPGDVKYKDLSGDGKIDNYDYTYQLKSSFPELYYGLQIGISWRRFGFDLKFQGVSGRTIPTVLASIYHPLYGGDKNISQHYLKNYWTPGNPGARYPRLTTLENKNNYLISDLWTEDGSFCKLREVELYYDLPQTVSKLLFLDGVRIFATGNNLFSIDSIGILDPEAINLNYPTARTLALGVKVTF